MSRKKSKRQRTEEARAAAREAARRSPVTGQAVQA